MPQEDGCCFNCGVANATTRDHVFSRALFPAPKPNLMTVPCCPACQALYYPDEGYFRDLTAGGAYANPHARALWEGPITRSFDRDGTARDALAQGLQRMEYRTPAGLYSETSSGSRATATGSATCFGRSPEVCSTKSAERRCRMT
jgi:hypothetical protein